MPERIFGYMELQNVFFLIIITVSCKIRDPVNRKKEKRNGTSIYIRSETSILCCLDCACSLDKAAILSEKEKYAQQTGDLYSLKKIA